MRPSEPGAEPPVEASSSEPPVRYEYEYVEEVLPPRAGGRPAWIPLAGAAVAAALLGTTTFGSQATTSTLPAAGALPPEPVAVPPAAPAVARPPAGAPPAPAPVAGVATTARSATAVGGGGSAASGTLLLTLRPNGRGLDEPIGGLAPGDSTRRYVDLVETGTLDGRDLRLTTRTAGRLVPLLRVTVDACRGGRWTPADDSCTGTTTRLLASTPLADLSTGRTLAPGGAARRLPLRVTLTLDDVDERSTNGRLEPDSVQGATAQISWSFTTTQAV